MAQDAEKQIKLLISKRSSLKGSITRLRNSLTSEFLDQASIQMLYAKEERLENLFLQYNEACYELNDSEDPTPIESAYFTCIDLLRTKRIFVKQETEPVNCINPKSDAKPPSTLKLPDIDIPVFSGNYLEYKPFIDLFICIIDRNSSYDPIQKLVYLRSFVKDEPYDLIKHLPVVGSSYSEALNMLNDRYNNKQKIIFEHITQLLDLPSISKPNVVCLRNLISKAKQNVAALKNLQQPVDSWDSVLVCILLRKLDPLTNREYCLQHAPTKDHVFTDFIKYLEGRAMALENSTGSDAPTVNKPSKLASAAIVSNNNKRDCTFCGKFEHKLFNCPKFMLASVDERMVFVKGKKLCKICLNSHAGKCRFHFKCTHCKQPHNSLLHKEGEQNAQSKSTALASGTINNSHVLLPTAKVKVITKDGCEIITKALLDSASQSSFITTSLATKLGRKLVATSINVIGVANTEKTIKQSVQLDVFSCAYPYKINSNFLVVDKITTNLPQTTFNLSNFSIPNNIKLADDTFNVESEIGILLSSDIFFQTLLPQPEEINKPSDPAHPSFVHTQFGYIVAGNIQVQPLQNATVSLFCSQCKSDINSTLNNFWQSEAVPEIYPEHLTSEQQYCEQYFKDTVKLVDNKFEVSIPLKTNDVNSTLGDSLGLALNRFLNLEKRFKKDEALFHEYQKFIQEFIDLGHASYVDISNYDLSQDAVYFIPHHPVIREEAVSTKLRTVFDGSMKASNKISLNDIMLNGPVVQPELFDILIIFRLHKYFFICDIRHMFRNILIAKDQRSLQNILWRDNPDQPIKCIQLKTVLYGLKASSFLATRCLNELAYRYQNELPQAASVILNSTYVDDILYTNNDLDSIIQTKQQLVELLAKGSFFLHKWSANDPKILVDIPENQQHFGDKVIQNDIKTLGLSFEINSDSFKFTPPPEQSAKTKREILSFISKFFDPLGLIGPILVQAKQIMQKLWLSKTDWDSVPPPDLQKEWSAFYQNLIKMQPIQVQRNACNLDQPKVQIIGFSDASNVAYGCAIYLRCTDQNGNVKMSLLCSKSRINPKSDKQLSVPRLELNSLLLLSKLVKRVYNTLIKKLPINEVHLFTDSQVTLAWLKTDPIKLNAYVANRVKMILDCTNNYSWAYINTNENPADCLSRGVKPCDLQNHRLWWSGPQVMSNSNYNFSDCNFEVPIDLPEMKPSACGKLACAVSLGTKEEFLDTFISKYSDINKAQRILAYVLRFCNNIKKNSVKHSQEFVTFTELNNALHKLIKHEQYKYFKKEIDSLQSVQKVNSNSVIKGLNPFIDKNGLLRVGGRLQHSVLPYAQKHQIILPKQSTITHLIIKNEHLRLLHGGQKLVLSSLSQRYWLTNGLRSVKNIIHKCLICFRFKAVTSQQLMGSLPADRVNVSRPYKKVGIDFAGPILVKQSRARSVITTKAYISIYVCFVTKAIHLELTSNLRTDTFLAGFKRFISRRNVPTDVWCDNQSTHKGANNELKQLYNLLNSKDCQNDVQNTASKLGINFHFIPSYSPVFGGLWEAAVKSVKHHLKRILGSHILTYEQLYTVLVQIEAVLNSRPLTSISSDPDDMSFLTPGHFLTGEPFTCIPEQDISNLPDNLVKFWSKCTALKQQFWKQWSKQYLNMLQNRPKWQNNVPNVKVGDLVILRELDTPPMTWPMARVTNVFPGSDNKVRALEVKKSNGKTHKTSITKICILPLN